MNIQWNKTTPFSLITAIILFIAVFALGFYLGQKWGTAKAILELNQEFNEEYVPINDNGNVENNYIYATFTCENNKIIYATFFNDNVQLYLNDDRDFLLSKQYLRLEHVMQQKMNHLFSGTKEIQLSLKKMVSSLMKIA